MKMTDFLFQRMIDLFCASTATPLWDNGDPWYWAPLLAPFTPGLYASAVPLAAQETLNEADFGFSWAAPMVKTKDVLTGKTVANVGVNAGSGDKHGWLNVSADPAFIPRTIYGYYLYWNAAPEESYGAELLPVPLPITELGQGFSAPIPKFTFNASEQI